jgi:hypothetical protein
MEISAKKKYIKFRLLIHGFLFPQMAQIIRKWFGPRITQIIYPQMAQMVRK